MGVSDALGGMVDASGLLYLGVGVGLLTVGQWMCLGWSQSYGSR